MKKLYFFALITICLFSFSSASFATKADDFASYVEYMTVQHRTYWDSKNELDRKIWRLFFLMSPELNPDNVMNPGGFDELLSAIKDITISFESPKGSCKEWSNDWNSTKLVDGPKTYKYKKIVKMAFMEYSTGVCPYYDRDLGQWYNPPTNSICFQEYDLIFDIPAKDFSITSAQCGIWLVVVTFDDGSIYENFDWWGRWWEISPDQWEVVPYAEIMYTRDPIPEDSGNSSRFNVNLKSFKIYRLPDKDYPDKNNLVLTWNPINPAFNGNLFPGLVDVPFWPGLYAKVGVVWQNDWLVPLQSSGIKHLLWSAFWVDIAAHLNHYFLPWNYIEHIEQNTTLNGFQIHFQVRTNWGARLRQSSFSDEVFRIDSDDDDDDDDD